jgi:hypothetical protein
MGQVLCPQTVTRRNAEKRALGGKLEKPRGAWQHFAA